MNREMSHSASIGMVDRLFSLAQAGLTPVIRDVDAQTLCLEGEYERPVLTVHLLGCPSSQQSLIVGRHLCGSWCLIDGARVGSRCVRGLRFLLFHISTGGGMITTSDSARRTRHVVFGAWMIRERVIDRPWNRLIPTWIPDSYS